MFRGATGYNGAVLSMEEEGPDSPVVARLRERYASLRLSTQEDFDDESADVSPSPLLSEFPSNSPLKSKGRKRWSLLKSAILMIPEKGMSTKSGLSETPPSSKTSTKSTSVEEEAAQLLNFWTNDSALEGAPINLEFPDIDGGARQRRGSNSSSSSRLFDEEPRPVEVAPAADSSAMQLVEDFTMQSKSVSLVISKLPEEVILKKKKQLDAEVVAEKRRDAQDNIKSQANLLYLENEARERVHRLQEKASDKVRKEKEAMVAEMFSREAAIGREFRRAREVLESDLKKEQAFLMEKHGTLLSGEQSISRRFDIKWTVCPQPIEMRIHVMRAVKNKLPKGSYVVMLTQFDRLGGKPLVWSVSGAYGISKDRPATTRPFLSLIHI